MNHDKTSEIHNLNHPTVIILFGKNLIPMTIFTQSRLLSKVLYLFSFLMLLVSNLQAQFCLGLNVRADEARPDEVFLDITSTDFNGIASMQFSIIFDPTVYKPIGLIESNLIGFGEGSTNYTPTGYDGAIVLAWFDQTAQGVTFLEDKPLITYKFEKLKESSTGFDFADNPVTIEVATPTEVFYNFQNCNTGQNLVPAIRGQLFLDANQNCELETSERATTLQSWRGWNIAASQNGEYYFSGFLKEDGSYEVKIFPGENQIEITRPGPYYDVCEASFTINSEDIDVESAFYEHLIQIKEECSFLEVSLASFPGLPCELGAYVLQYRNNGTANATDVYIDLNLDYRVAIEEMDADYTDLGDSKYRINIGDLTIGESGFVFMKVDLPCDLTAEETLRNDAQIFPNQPCGELSNDWSGASLKVNGTCDGNQIIFEFENIGDADMSEPTEYVVIEDAIIFRTQNVRLAKGERKTVTLPATGASYFIQVDQERGHPGSYIPSALVEACGRNESGGFSTGFANRFPEENNDLAVAVDYQVMSVNDEAHHLLASPRGFSDAHFIEPNNAIEYTLHFKNTSNGLQIVDEFSPMLDVTTFKPLSASESYEYTLEEGVLTLTVPPALPSSFLDFKSYVKFSISPKGDLPMGSVISNHATLNYSEERVEQTNSVFHTIETDFIERSTPTVNLPTSITELTVYPNPSSEAVIFTIKDWQPIDYQLTIMDVDGKVLQKNKLNNRQYQFQKGNLPSGTYLYRLLGENGVVAHGFFVLVD